MTNHSYVIYYFVSVSHKVLGVTSCVSHAGCVWYDYRQYGGRGSVSFRLCRSVRLSVSTKAGSQRDWFWLWQCACEVCFCVSRDPSILMSCDQCVLTHMQPNGILRTRNQAHFEQGKTETRTIRTVDQNLECEVAWERQKPGARHYPIQAKRSQPSRDPVPMTPPYYRYLWGK